MGSGVSRAGTTVPTQVRILPSPRQQVRQNRQMYDAGRGAGIVLFLARRTRDPMTTNLSTTWYTPGQLTLVPAGRKAGDPIPVADVPEWLATLLRDLPKPSEYRLAAEYNRAVVDFCLERWRVGRSAEAPSVEEAGGEFRDSMTAANDLSHRQVDQMCDRTFGSRGDLPAWLCETTERFLTLIRPWTPVWHSFTSWALRWCRQNSIDNLVFLARDALPFFVAATAMEQGRHLHLAHVSRAIRATALTS